MVSGRAFAQQKSDFRPLFVVMQQRIATTTLRPQSVQELFGVVGSFIFGVGLLIRRDAPQLAVDLASEVASSV